MIERASPDTRTQYWKEQIGAWQASGQSQQAFCEANELIYPRFGYWLCKFREQGAVAAAPRRPSGFVPVIASPASGDLTVRLPNGIELHGVTVDNPPLVEQLLARLCTNKPDRSLRIAPLPGEVDMCVCLEHSFPASAEVTHALTSHLRFNNNHIGTKIR